MKTIVTTPNSPAGAGSSPASCSRIRVVLWFRNGWDHWKGPYAFKRNVTPAVLWSLSLGGIEIRRQVVGTWGIANGEAVSPGGAE